MKANRVRPGALVRARDGSLRVLVDIQPGADWQNWHLFVYADGEEVKTPDAADVEVVKLTGAQIAGLLFLVNGTVVFDHTGRARPANGLGSVRQSVYDGLVDLGLVSRQQGLTPLGRAYLEAMGAKK